MRFGPVFLRSFWGINQYMAVMLMINHAVWFSFYSQSYRPFEEVMAFFMICVWLVPFSFFISMTANEDTLPYGSTISAGTFNKHLYHIYAFAGGYIDYIISTQKKFLDLRSYPAPLFRQR